MKTMNYIKIGIASSILSIAAGCTSFLEEDLKSSLAPDNTYTSSLGFEVGATGLYAIARSEYNTWGENGAFMHNGACAYEVLQISTDLCRMGTVRDGSLVPFAEMTLNPSTLFVGSYWNWAYNLIASANELLIYSEKNDNWDYPTDKQLYQAEARFFRAYAYRTLVYLYGDVPWVETIQKPFLLSFSRDPKSEVLGNIIKDLEFAKTYLPDNPDNVKEGKLTTWAARHLLSEMYLLRGAEGDYKLAEENAQDVIDCPYYSLMKSRFGNAKNDPGDYFSDMFVENNQNRSAGNTEGIWVMQFQYNTVGGGTNSDDWTRRAWNPQYHAIDGFALADSLGGRGLAQIYPLKWWIGVKGTNATTAGEKEGFPGIQEKGIFEDGDIRNSEYNIKRNWYYNNPLTPNKLGQKCPIDDKSWSQAQLFPALKKFFFGKEENLQLTGAYKDRMKFRLAETYLLLAEAYLRQDMPDEYLVSYTTKLDLLNNNFGSSTAIVTSEDDGIFSRSYTSEQINNWANERWKVPVNKTFTLAFRVIAEYAGGPTYEMPEVRTVEVTVTPIKVDVFDADKVSLSGTAISSVTEIEKTVENANLYAWYGELSIGELQIPVELEGQTYYIVPSDGNGALRDGELVDVKMTETPVSWNIPSAGNYRLLIDMENKQVRIYSSATDLKPLSVTFHPSGAEANPEATIEVLDLYAYGAGTGWGVRKLNLKQSFADPQILIYDAEEHNGTKLSSGMKFCVAQNFSVGDADYNQNNAYCFTCPLTAEGKKQNLTLTLGKVGELHGGADGETRNSYYTIPASDLLIFDLRHGTILARNK